MGRRRRRVIKVVKKKLPNVFVCPSCGEEAVKVLIRREGGRAIVQCGACQLREEFDSTPSSQLVDIYCRFTDKYYSKGEVQPP